MHNGVDPPKFVCVCFFLWGPFPGDESGCIDSGRALWSSTKNPAPNYFSIDQTQGKGPFFSALSQEGARFWCRLMDKIQLAMMTCSFFHDFFTWVKQLWSHKLVGVVWCCHIYIHAKRTWLEHLRFQYSSQPCRLLVLSCTIVRIFAEGSIHIVQRFRWFRILIKGWLSATWPIIRMVGGPVGWLWREKHPQSVPRSDSSSKMRWFR